MKIQEAKEILTSLNRLSLCSYDTPIQHLKHLEELTGINGLYIKRDDLNGVGPGGNKVRALEYLLGSAVENHSDIVIASGQMNSNLCTIAAAACCKIGIHCILVHNNDEPKYPTGNTILNNLLGIERVYLGEKPESYRNEYIMQMAIELKKKVILLTLSKTVLLHLLALLVTQISRLNYLSITLSTIFLIYLLLVAMAV